MLNSSSEAVVVSGQGLAIKTRSANVRRVPESERLDAGRILEDVRREFPYYGNCASVWSVSGTLATRRILTSVLRRPRWRRTEKGSKDQEERTWRI